MDISIYIWKFIRVVEAAWRPLLDGLEVSEAEEVRVDWLQFNWELLVEGQLINSDLAITLDTYGYGADTETGRISRSFENPLHGAFCKPKSGRRLCDLMRKSEPVTASSEYLLREFGNYSSGYLSLQPPFEVAVVEHPEEDEPILLNIEDLMFELRPLTRARLPGDL